MPIAKETYRQPQKAALSLLPRRTSNIPRPTKQLIVDKQLNHASKPLKDILPRTPANKIFNNQNLMKSGSHNNNKIVHSKYDPEVTVLELTPFCRQPIVNFGRVQIGTTQNRTVILRNSQECQQQLFIITFPKPIKGLYIDATEFLIAARTETSVTIAWTPKNVGGIRETITFQDINRMPRRIVVLGSAYQPQPEVPKQQVRSKPRSIYHFSGHSKSNKSPQKINHERSQLVFSPAAKRAAAIKADSNVSAKEPLTRLLHGTRRRQSALVVRKILSKFDDVKATKIQSYWRMVLAQRTYKSLRSQIKATTTIQSYWRMFVARRKYQKTKNSIIVLQNYWRMLLAKRTYSTLRSRNNAAIKIQSYWRMCLSRQRYLETRKSIIVVQANWRMLLARREYSTLRSENQAAITIQSHWRMFVARQAYIATLNSIIVLQSHWRMLLAQRSFITLRSQNQAAIKIQSYWRMVNSRRRYLQTRNSIVSLQTHWRMLLAQRRYRILKCQSQAAITIQSYWKMFVARQRYLETRNSIVTVQTHWRRLLAQRRYAILRSQHQAAIKIQSHWKRFVARRRYLRTRESIVVFQAHWRGVLARRNLARLKALVETIVGLQKYGRGMILRRRLERSIQALHNCQSMAANRHGILQR